MINILHIGGPYIKQAEDSVSLLVDTVWKKGNETYEHTFYYKVDTEWGKYFVTEKSDAWVLVLLETAMENGFDIEFEAPLSEDLKYQLER